MGGKRIDYCKMDNLIKNTDLSINAIAKALRRSPSTVCRRAKRIGIDRFERSFNKGGRPIIYPERHVIRFADPFWTPKLKPLEGLSGYINNGREVAYG